MNTDLRKSKTNQFSRAPITKGLSDYLAEKVVLTEIISDTPIKNIWYIAAGSIPPNPGELLLTERLKKLLETLKKDYDFVVLDTAPVGLVSDALPLLKLSDINLFVIRSGYSRYTSAALPDKLSQTYELKNLYLILNDVKSDFLYRNYYKGGYYG